MDGTTSRTAPMPRRWKPASQRWRQQLEKLAKNDCKVKRLETKVVSVVFGTAGEFIIGRGCKGTDVFLGLADDGTEVAVKRMTLVNISPLKNEASFLRLKKLDHPSIVKYVDYAEDENFGYLALQLCEYNLKQYITKHKPSEEQRKQLAKQFLQSLRVLHCQNPLILHRDIKPENVFIDTRGKVRLADFGTSRRLEEGQTTRYTDPVGTECWMAKETLEDGGHVPYKTNTDIQVAGMLIYYILSGGKHPFGRGVKCEQNILDGIYNLDHVQDEAKDLIKQMINAEPQMRLTVEECLDHPYWSNESESGESEEESEETDEDSEESEEFLERMLEFSEIEEESEEREEERPDRPESSTASRVSDPSDQPGPSPIRRGRRSFFQLFRRLVVLASLFDDGSWVCKGCKTKNDARDTECRKCGLLKGASRRSKKPWHKRFHQYLREKVVAKLKRHVHKSSQFQGLQLSESQAVTYAQNMERQVYESADSVEHYGYMLDEVVLGGKLHMEINCMYDPKYIEEVTEYMESWDRWSRLLDDAQDEYYDLPGDKVELLEKLLSCKEISGSNEEEVTSPPGDQEAVIDQTPRTWIPVSERWRPQLEKLRDVDQSEVTRVSSVVFRTDDEFCIAQGSGGTEVFLGLRDDGTEVAVKGTTKSNYGKLQNERHLLCLPKLKDHPSIVQHVGCTEDENFGYLALQLCEYNLKEYIIKFKDELSEEQKKELAEQFLQSLKALHCQYPEIVHRDINPQNLLIDVEGRARLSDFGISLQLPKGQTTINTRAEGTKYWMAKETLDNDDASGRVPCRRSTDIQVSGMLIYYILSGGHHPFGPVGPRCQSNIVDGTYNLDHVQDEVSKDLIKQMINAEPEMRPTVEECLDHPFFWSNRRRVEFLQAVANEQEINKPYENPDHQTLMEVWQQSDEEGRFNTWKHKLPQEVLGEVENRRKTFPYQDDGFGLLLFMHDLHQHHAEAAADIDLMEMFPGLFDCVFTFVKHQGWNKRDTLKKMFRPTSTHLQDRGAEDHFVDLHQDVLIHRVMAVDRILDLLLLEGVITHEGYDDMRSKATTQDKMRELRTLLDSRKAKDVFYKGLEEHEKLLVHELNAQPEGASPSGLDSISVVPHPKDTTASTQESSVEILKKNKEKLVSLLSFPDFHYILQHARSAGIVDGREYRRLKTTQPEGACMDLIDSLMSRGEEPSAAFLELLKEPKICCTYNYAPLKDWIRSLDPDQFVLDNKCELVQDVRWVEPILDLLLGEKVISLEVYDKVRAARIPTTTLHGLLTTRRAREVFYRGFEEY